jgi:hypothetical protein
MGIPAIGWIAGGIAEWAVSGLADVSAGKLPFGKAG